MRQIKGFSSIEILVALMLSIPCFTAICVIFNQSFKNYNQERKIKAEVYNFIRLKQLLNTISQEIDLHPFFLLPKVHKKGQIKFTNGKNNPILKAKTNLRPEPDSDAISYIRLSLENTLEILNISNGINAYACSRYNSKIAQKQQSFLALGPQGLNEVTSVITGLEKNNLKECAYLNLKLTDSMITGPVQGVNINLIRFLIPAERIYTIYIDRKKTLRYLGHNGANNIENQPILDKFGSVRINTSILSGDIIKISASIHNKFIKNPLSFDLINKLSRANYLNFLLNRL